MTKLTNAQTEKLVIEVLEGIDECLSSSADLLERLTPENCRYSMRMKCFLNNIKKLMNENTDFWDEMTLDE